MKHPINKDSVAQQRDEIIKRMFATPPKPHKDTESRRLIPAAGVKQLPKRRTNKPRKSKA